MGPDEGEVESSCDRVQGSGGRGQGTAYRGQESGDKDQKMQSKKKLYVILNPEPRTLDPGPCINLRHDGFAELDRDHAGTARFFHGDAVEGVGHLHGPLVVRNGDEL